MSVRPNPEASSATVSSPAAATGSAGRTGRSSAVAVAAPSAPVTFSAARPYHGADRSRPVASAKGCIAEPT